MQCEGIVVGRTLRLERIELRKKRRDVHNDARADNAGAGGIHETYRNPSPPSASLPFLSLDPKQSRAKRTAGKQMERKRLESALEADGYDNGVPRVVTTCAPGTDVELGGEDVDELSLAFVAPL